MPLAQPLLVRTENQRHVRKLRQRGANRPINQDLLGRVRDVIVAANHVRNRHLDVVGHDGEVIGGMTVRSENDEILDVERRSIWMAPWTRSSNRTVRRRDPHANGARRVRRVRARRFPRCKSGTSPVVAPSTAGPLGRLSFGFQSRPECSSSSTLDLKPPAAPPSLDGARSAAIESTGRTVRQSSALRPSRCRASGDRRGCLRPFLRTIARRRCPRCAARRRRHARRREEPVEERGACAADVKVAGRRRGESDARRGHDAIVILARQPAEAERSAWV